MAQNLLISYNSQENKFNQTANQNVPNVQVKETNSIETVKDFLDVSIGGIQKFIENEFKNVTDVPKSLKFAISKQLGVPGLVLNYSVELHKATEKGITGYKAIYTAGREVFESSVVSTIGGAIGSGLVIAAEASLAAAGITVSTPVVAGAGIFIGIAGALYATKKYEKARNLNDLVSNKIDDFVNFVSGNSLTNLKNTKFNLVTEPSFQVESSNKFLEPGNNYLTIPKTSGGFSVTLDENDRAIFLSQENNQSVYYSNVKGGKGIKVDLGVGTTEIARISGVKDYLGDAVINVTGTQYDDVIRGKELVNQSPISGKFDNKFKGNEGNDYLFGGSGKDTLTGSSGVMTGKFEKDILLGGSEQDIFVLGEGGKVFYTNGNDIDPNPPDFAKLPVGTFITPKDFAVLGDFNPTEDKIQLTGSKKDYFVRSIENKGVISALGNQENFDLSFLNPKGFSTTILNKSGELIAIIPTNLKSALDVFSADNPLNETNVLNAVNFV
jgi:Ca2+-binding RTX toxin-like protein